MQLLCNISTVLRNSHESTGTASCGLGQVDYLSWSRGVKLEDIPFVVQHCRTVGPLTLSALNKHELQLLQNMLGRLCRVAETAAQVS